MQSLASSCRVAAGVVAAVTGCHSEGSLLDHSLMLHGSPMANSNAHDHSAKEGIELESFGDSTGRIEI